MRCVARVLFALFLAAGPALAEESPAPGPAEPAEEAAGDLAKELKALKRDVKRLQRNSLGSWLSVGGEYRFRFDSLSADVAPHADAMEFMNTMAADLLGRASNPAAPEYDPQAVTDFFLTADPADRMQKLFNFFPAAMANNITMATDPAGPFGGASLIDALAGMTPAQVAGALQMTALTGQQAAILNSLLTPEMFGAVLAGLPADQQAAVMGIMADPDKARLFQQMVGQGLLGGGEGSYVQGKPRQKVRNRSLYTNRLILNLDAKATENVSVHMRFLMYKTWGSMDDDAVTGNYFADRVGVFDGTSGHVPSSGYLNVDRAYATWSNIGGQPVWFSVGRRPSTGGAPGHVRQYGAPPGSGGVPSLLVDYAFDGLTLGVAPEWGFLPGFFAKLCYGRGFESGLERDDDDNLKDTDMLGVAVVAVDTAPLRVDLQWNRGMNIFDFPVMKNTVFGDTAPATELGDIDWYGLGALGSVRSAGLTWFASYGLSITHPNDNVSANAGNQGLLTGDFFAAEEPEDKSGWAVYLGARFDIAATGTSLGGEFNHGSKNWITFAPAADDMWTAKLGTRGNVYEAYLIQDLNLEAISSYFSKAFFRIGYQYYDFEYTGSNNWVGAPKRISELDDLDLALLAPVERARNLYASFSVRF